MAAMEYECPNCEVTLDDDGNAVTCPKCKWSLRSADNAHEYYYRADAIREWS